MALGMPSQCWKGLTHSMGPTSEYNGPRRRRVISPPTREEYVLPDVVAGLGVGLTIGAEQGDME